MNSVLDGLRRLIRNDQLILAVLAVAVGAAGAGGAIAFRELIALVQTGFFGFGSERVGSLAAGLAWWHLLLAPAAGGLVIGLFIEYAMPERCPRGVADAIEAAALRNGRMPLAPGLGAALVSAASIGVGASVGREGPVVHLGATLGSWLADRLRLNRAMTLSLLACGVASGVAASFNAPLAGVIFALEVVLGHYALSAFAPVVIAGVTGTVLSRLYFGDFPAFIVSEHAFASFAEFPAFALLGILSAALAILFIRGTLKTGEAAERLPLPGWARPALGGLFVGAVAVFFPHVLGVGYEATDNAIKELFPLSLLFALLAAKFAATVVSIGFGFGGGVFSPSLYLGAMLGGAYGTLVVQFFPGLATSAGAYTLVGMGAVAGAVLGAPISTILIIFELTGNYSLTIAVMVAVVIASVITQRLQGHSFFSCQIESRGLDLESGREAALIKEVRVRGLIDRDLDTVDASAGLAELRERISTARLGKLFVVDGAGRLVGTIIFRDLSGVIFDASQDGHITASDVLRENPPVLNADDDLGAAMALMKESGEAHLAVVEDGESMRLMGCLHEGDVMTAYAEALHRARAEERGGA